MALQVNATAEEAFRLIVGSLRIAREDAGLSRHALSSRLPVRHGSIFDWEKGIGQPTWKNFVLWARELGYRLAILGPDGGERRVSSKRTNGEPLEVRELRRLAIPLKTLRVARGLTLVDVSDTIGVDRNSLQRWENASVKPLPKALIVWAQAMNCSLVLQPRSLRVRPSVDPQLNLGRSG